jgi:hypothetical protein
MARGSRTQSHDTDAMHPLERLALVLSEDSFEDDGGAREDQWARKVRGEIDAKLARMRRQLRLAPSSPRRASRISAELRALDRAGLLMRLDALQQVPGVRIAHLALSGLTTEDLRLLVAELEATAQTQESPK